jgi:hypothetical protein
MVPLAMLGSLASARGFDLGEQLTSKDWSIAEYKAQLAK